jgi:thymidylate synthase
MSAYMRGNDAVIGLLCDVFSFTMIQEFAARLLGVPVGTYAHHVGSMHINVRDLDQVRAILTETETRAGTGDVGGRPKATTFPTVTMPTDTTWHTIDTVLEVEESLRRNTEPLSPERAATVPVAPYWRRVLLLFEAYRQIMHSDQPVTTVVLDALDPGHRWLLAARWPDRIPATVGRTR